jgi:hypothetical protein
MEITIKKLQLMLNTAAEMGARQVIDRLGLEKKQVTRNEAYKLYGRTRVDRWYNEGLVERTADGRQTYYNKSQLEKQASIHRLVERCYEEDNEEQNNPIAKVLGNNLE